MPNERLFSSLATPRAAAAVLSLAAPAFAQPDPSGIDFVTIGAPGNPAYNGPDPTGRVTGRGGVGYEFKLSRTEVTTAQWVEFYNIFKARADAVPDHIMPIPITWGAEVDPTYTGPGRRFRLRAEADAGIRPVYGIDWRTSARFCNWLHNDKGVALSAIANGAYDTATFAYPAPGQFSDQATRSPGARYWIPSLDEWMKGAHYDPANPTRDGWWLYSNRSDNPLNYGPPGQGDANSGFALPNFGEFRIPLISYPTVQSPWGLLDVAGCGREWTEEILVVNGDMYRVLEGSAVSDGIDSARNADRINVYGGDFPSASGVNGGFRIATIPSAGTASLFWTLVGACWVRRRRSTRHEIPLVRHDSRDSVRGGDRVLGLIKPPRRRAADARPCVSKKCRSPAASCTHAKTMANRSR